MLKCQTHHNQTVKCHDPMNEDLKSKILNEIKKSGFPTELEVSNLFQKNGWEVNFNSYYLDQDENKGREIDLVADFCQQKKGEDYTELHFFFIIEVKKELKKPWIIITTKPTGFERTMGLPNYRTINKSLNFQKVSKAFNSYNQKLHERVGRSGFEGFNQGKDKLFGSLCNTIKAMNHFKGSNSFASDTSTDKMMGYYEPLIILDGELIEATLDSESKIVVSEANYLQVKFDYLSPQYPKQSMGHLIHIVRKSYLTEFLESRKQHFVKIAKSIMGT